jgi:CRISPR-associated protein Cmr4
MYKIAKPLFLYCQTPTHVGSGSDLGIVDLPIQRERHTNFPKFESSSLKGALRQRFEAVYPVSDKKERIKIHLTFGYDDAGEDKSITDEFKNRDASKFEPQYAGALGFTDARLLFFPVKSMRGVFALVTCPYVLDKFAQELELTTADNTKVKNLKDALAKLQVNNLSPTADEGFCYTNSSELLLTSKNAKNIVLEEYAFTVKEDYEELSVLMAVLSSLRMPNLGKKLVILHNDDFADFVTLHTEVITRNKIDNKTGTVDKKIGGLFSEEFLPAESVLYALVMASPIFQTKKSDFSDNDSKKEAENVMKFFTDTISGQDKAKGIFQIGGNATLGKGITKLQI